MFDIGDRIHLLFLSPFFFPSNAGRTAAGAGGRKLREDALLLGPFFFSAGKRSLFVIPAAFLSRLFIERMA